MRIEFPVRLWSGLPIISFTALSLLFGKIVDRDTKSREMTKRTSGKYNSTYFYNSFLTNERIDLLDLPRASECTGKDKRRKIHEVIELPLHYINVCLYKRQKFILLLAFSLCSFLGIDSNPGAY